MIPPERYATPSLVRPFLHALDRLQQREMLRPVQLTERAVSLLAEYFGAKTVPVEAAFAHGSLALIGDHTHHVGGFALMRSVAHGMAVAVRGTEEAGVRVALEGEGAWAFGPDRASGSPAGAPRLARAVGTLLRCLAPPGYGVEAVVVGTVPQAVAEARLGASGVAAARALQALLARADDTTTLIRAVRTTLSEVMEQPFSAAYLLASDAGRAEAFILVDTHTLESLPVMTAGQEKPGWGLVAMPEPPPDAAEHDRHRVEKAGAALELLRRKGFATLASFRELEHRDLQRALDVLPRRYRPVVRYLVTANRLVPKLVGAVRRGDWQMFGALLLMSHAAQRNDWGNVTPEADFVVEQVRAMSLEGLYGAHITGRGGGVLLVGQPFALPAALDRIQAAFEDRFGLLPETLLL
ncbi:hypothetical protein GQ464_010195 [Rhodocaloribacter litoris]|uniref:galactokinase family protein n=1 Tax=Rhodocaloribacter litoris TaxID=2558931 RepID=UPI0014223B0B|nr:galactokinase family protein [Rhodocaloribacter litoris]QXD13841.1 hypothetical protein GQ464_010195 [Rhodocaloribacter litoris]